LLIWAGLLTIGISPAGAQIFEEDDDAGPATKVSELLRYVQFRIVGGRVVADSERQGLSLTTETRDSSSGTSERLTLDMSNESPGLRYERKTAQDEVTIELNDGDHLIARRTAKGNAGSVEFEQRPAGELKLSITSGGERHTVQATTLWHLLLLEPVVGQKQLIPLLEILHPSWQLSAKATAIETSLLRWAEMHRHVDRARLARLVQALGDPHFVARRAAERELAAIGEPALMYLAALRRQDLDAEQWQRVQTLLAVLSGDREDTVDRCVGWLAGDSRVWLALLARDDERTRRAAADELRLLLGTTIEFDPAAHADQRAAQIKRLGVRIEKLEAAEVHPPSDAE
jgi:hypothetical protein